MSDKYDDLKYGNTWKTIESLFTVREIEMFCREWGWHHIEHLNLSKWTNPQGWNCAPGSGYFTGIDGNEYHTHQTFRTLHDRISPYDLKGKEELKPILKAIAGDYYGKNREQYYFYDVLMPIGDYIHNAWKDWDGTFIKYPPAKESIDCHGKKYGKLILIHMGVSNGKMWEYVTTRSLA